MKETDSTELRGHHLLSLVEEHDLPGITDGIRKVRFKLLGCKDDSRAERISRIMTDIVLGHHPLIKIIDNKDVICDGCPQDKGDTCHVGGRDWSKEFLARVDREMAKNAGLAVGETYEISKLLAEMDNIRKGVMKTFLSLPGLLKAKKIKAT